ncbi:response regulator, partial [Myxococcota bacterium]
MLMIDDDSDDVQRVREMLQGAPEIDVQAVDGLVPGLRYLSTRATDVVLLDLDLPESQGLESLRAIVGAVPHVPVVVLTGPEDEATGLAAVREGAQEYLVKPATPGWMLARILRFTVERQQTNELARQSEESYRLLYETMAQGVMRHTPDGRIVSANPAARRILGLTEDEILDRTSDDPRWRSVREDGSDLPGSERPTIVALRTGREVRARVIGMYNAREEAWRWISVTAVPLFKPGEIRPDTVYATFEDITEQKQTEALVRSRLALFEFAVSHSLEELLQRTLDEMEALTNSPIGFYHFVASDQIHLPLQAWSTRTLQCCEVTAEREHQPVDRAGVWTECIHSRKPVIHNDYLALPHRRGTPVEHPQLVRQILLPVVRSGRVLAVLLHFGMANKPVDYTPRDVETVSHLADISWEIIERKKEEQKRADLQDQLWLSQKMEAVGRLAGGVAHDFNNILGVITSYSEFAAEGLNDDDPLKQDIQEIQKASERATVLTRQLLAFSRKQTVQPQAISLNRVLRDMEPMLGRLIGEDIDLRLELAVGLGSLRADPGQMEQVIMNLAINARDAMQGGGQLLIETANVDLGQEHIRQIATEAIGGACVMLAVTDNGSGMDETTKSRLFEPFFSTKGVGRGTGLGLATVYGIVKQSGGSIGVFSQIRRGTTFKIYLPRTAEAADTVTGESPAKVVATGHETVMVVEDEEALREATKRMLLAAGYRVLTAGHGTEALQLSDVHPGPIHLLITDVVMPRMSGRQLALVLTQRRPNMRVIYTSGYTDNALAQHGVLDPLTKFISKPFSIGELTRMVREVLDSMAPVRSSLAPLQPHSSPSSSRQVPGHGEELRRLPAEARNALRTAAMGAQYDELLATAECLRATEPGLATALANQINRFDYDSVLAWLKEAEGSPPTPRGV